MKDDTLHCAVCEQSLSMGHLVPGSLSEYVCDDCYRSPMAPWARGREATIASGMRRKPQEPAHA